jgi:hypothetical protein
MLGQKENSQNSIGQTLSAFGRFGPPVTHFLLASHQPHCLCLVQSLHDLKSSHGSSPLTMALDLISGKRFSASKSLACCTSGSLSGVTVEFVLISIIVSFVSFFTAGLFTAGLSSPYTSSAPKSMAVPQFKHDSWITKSKKTATLNRFLNENIIEELFISIFFY